MRIVDQLIEERNKAAASWAKKEERLIKDRMGSLGIKHRLNSKSTASAISLLTAKTYKWKGAINRIGFKFPIHMIYVHYGVGKGTKAGQQGNTKREAKNWLNSVLSSTEGVEKLADEMANYEADIIANHIFID